MPLGQRLMYHIEKMIDPFFYCCYTDKTIKGAKSLKVFLKS
jgi:hypothetical protein